MDKEKALFERYENFVEHLFEEHRWYRELVYLSKITKMFAYLLLGMSIIIVVISGGNLFTFENLIIWMSKTPLGKIFTLIIGVAFIVYGLEKPRS